MRAVKQRFHKEEIGTGTTARVLALLSCFGERQEWTIAELAARLGLPKSTTHRLVNLCSESGFIEANGGGCYSVGPEFSRVASQVAMHSPMLRVGTRLIRAIADQCKEVSVVAAAVPEKLAFTYLAKAEPSAEFRYHVELNVLLPLAWGACGRSILAHLPQAQVEHVVARGGPSPSGAPFDAGALLADLDFIRKKGYCVSRGQHKLTAVGIAVPFFGAGGVVRGALGMSIPTFRFKAGVVRPLVDVLEARAREMTYALGGPA
jgi:IclR family KDG regulon transcriptional repressor